MSLVVETIMWRAITIVLLSFVLFTGCAALVPSQPLLDPSLYPTVAVLPARVVIETGTPPWTRPDDALSGRMGNLVQRALADVMELKGYRVQDTAALNEKLAGEGLEERFHSLAAALGFRPSSGGKGEMRERGLQDSTSLAEALGADLLVLVKGSGEYFSAFDLVGHEFRPFLAMTRSGDDEPPRPSSTLQVDIRFIDPVRQAQVARIRGTNLDYSSNLDTLTTTMKHLLWRVPGKTDPENPK